MDDEILETSEKDKLKGDVKIPFFTLVKRSLAYAKPEAKRFILALVILVVQVVIDLLLPLIVSNITDSLSELDINIRRILTCTKQILL